MPRLRKTESQRRAERFREAYRVGKARVGTTDEKVGDAVGLHRVTICRIVKDPDNFFRFGVLNTLQKNLGWTDDELLAIIHACK